MNNNEIKLTFNYLSYFYELLFFLFLASFLCLDINRREDAGANIDEQTNTLLGIIVPEVILWGYFIPFTLLIILCFIFSFDLAKLNNSFYVKKIAIPFLSVGNSLWISTIGFFVGVLIYVQVFEPTSPIFFNSTKPLSKLLLLLSLMLIANTSTVEWIFSESRKLNLIILTPYLVMLGILTWTFTKIGINQYTWEILSNIIFFLTLAFLIYIWRKLK